MSYFTQEHIYEINLCYQFGYDTSPLYSRGRKGPSYKVDELHEIRLTIQAGFDPKPLLDLNDYGYAVYSARHMKELRLGLEHNVDISFYDGYNIAYWPIHTPERMKQIRLGLEEGLDVTIYNNWDDTFNKPVYNAEQCKVIREVLLYNRDNPDTPYPIQEILNPSISSQDMLNIRARWDLLRIREERLAIGELPDIGYYSEQDIYSPKELAMIDQGLRANKDLTSLVPIIKNTSSQITAVFTYCAINDINYSALLVKDVFDFFLYNAMQMSKYIKSGDHSILEISEWGYPIH